MNVKPSLRLFVVALCAESLAGAGGVSAAPVPEMNPELTLRSRAGGGPFVFQVPGDLTLRSAHSVAFWDTRVLSGNGCEFVTFPGLGHSYNSSKLGPAGKPADQKTREQGLVFLASLGLMPNPKPGISH